MQFANAASFFRGVNIYCIIAFLASDDGVPPQSVSD